MDVNASGGLNAEEFHAALKTFLPEADIRNVKRLIKTYGQNGELTFSDFLMLCMNSPSRLNL